MITEDSFDLDTDAKDFTNAIGKCLPEEVEDVVGSSASQLEEVDPPLITLYRCVAKHVVIGGKKFSKNLTPLDADGNPVGMWGVS